MAAMKKPTPKTAAKPHPSSRVERRFELTVRSLPYPNPITAEQKLANRTPVVVTRKFPTVVARKFDAAKKEAKRILRAEGFEPLFVSFAEGNRIAAIVKPKSSTAPALPLSTVRR